MSRWSLTEHPASVGETYAEHLCTAAGFGMVMIIGGGACLVHGILPFLFTRTGSTTVAKLQERMITHRTKPSAGRTGADRS